MILRILVLLLVLIGTAGPGWAGKPVALVIGVDTYANVKPLHKAVSDARAVYAALVEAGFAEADVRLLENATSAQIAAEWESLLGSVEKDGVVLFYFAGHGVELSSQNYLLPSDVLFDEHDDQRTRSTAIGMKWLIDTLAKKQETTNAVGIFILDACRNDPFKGGGSAGASQGLSPVHPPRRMFVMYSAGIGQTALDGKGANSVFATVLLPMLRQKPSQLGLADIAQNLRFDVYREAQTYNDPPGNKHMQTPAYYDQLMFRQDIFGIRKDPLPITGLGSPGVPALPGGFAARDIVVECEFCPELVVIPAGEFKMGSPDGEAGRSVNEGPQHPVKIPRPLAFGKFEVTNREWNACAAEAGSGCLGSRDRISRGQRDREPVTGVSWTAADAYVTWLSRKTGKAYRLPSEAEWEYAARAGTSTPYSFESGKLDDLCQYANGADRSVGELLMVNSTCDDDIGRTTAQAGSFKPNPFGLFDMNGNVWEWVADCWEPDYAARVQSTESTARQPATGTCTSYVARGGSWRSGPSALRSAVRNTFRLDHSRATLGFRVVRDLDVAP